VPPIRFSTGVDFSDGLLSDDGKAYTLDQNQADRQALCDKYLDPWVVDTSREDYTDGQVSVTLAGRQLDLRTITLNLQGQEAYDFALRNMKAIRTDALFSDMDALLGGMANFLTTDLYDVIQTLLGKNTGPGEIHSIVGDLVTQLEALTPDEIAAAKFVVSVIFHEEKPIGISIEASTTGKAFLLDGIVYRAGLEHEVKLHYKSVAGETASIELSTVSAGGDNYDVKGNVSAKTADGLETYSGGYTGTLAETDTQYDLTGKLALDVQYFNDEEGVAGSGILGGDLVLSIARDTTGYTGTGTLAFWMDAGEETTVSVNIGLGATLQYADTVQVTPPMYTSANITEVTGKADLWAIHQSELGDMQQYGGLAQLIKLLFAFLLG
jgi:hypothetical protein